LAEYIREGLTELSLAQICARIQQHMQEVQQLPGKRFTTYVKKALLYQRRRKWVVYRQDTEIIQITDVGRVKIVAAQRGPSQTFVETRAQLLEQSAALKKLLLDIEDVVDAYDRGEYPTSPSQKDSNRPEDTSDRGEGVLSSSQKDDTHFNNTFNGGERFPSTSQNDGHRSEENDAGFEPGGLGAEQAQAARHPFNMADSLLLKQRVLALANEAIRNREQMTQMRNMLERYDADVRGLMPAFELFAQRCEEMGMSSS